MTRGTAGTRCLGGSLWPPRGGAGIGPGPLPAALELPATPSLEPRGGAGTWVKSHTGDASLSKVWGEGMQGGRGEAVWP